MRDSSPTRQIARWTWLTLAGVLLLLLAALGLTTQQRVQRTQELMVQSLGLHGALTVQYLEAAARAGMRHGLWRVWMPQALVDDLVEYLQVRSLAILGPQGQVLISAPGPEEEGGGQDPWAGLGEEQRQAIAQRKPLTALVGQELVVGQPFEPFRRFLRHRNDPHLPHLPPGPPPPGGEPSPPDAEAPAQRGPGGGGQGWRGGMGMMMGQGRPPGLSPGQALPDFKGYALVRLSSASLMAARAQDLRQAWLLAGLIFLAGGAAALGLLAVARRRGRELERLRKEVIESEHLASVGRLAGSVAHEVRNPLSALRGLVQFLAKDREPGSKQAEYAQVAVAEVDRLERVVSGLLEYTRPRAPRRFPLDLEESLQSALALMADDPRAQGVEMVLELPAALPSVQADPDQIRQVLVNLLLNSLEAVNGRGRIVLSARQERWFVRVEVADNGPGLPPADLDRLFDPFYSTRERGSGLGLAIAKRIVEAHGGVLKAANQPQGGAILTFTLPLAGDKA